MFNPKYLLVVFSILLFSGYANADICEDHNIGPTSGFTFDWGAPDDGTLDGAMETWTTTFTAANGNYSYDIGLTITTDNAGGLLEGSDALDVRAGETHTFTLNITNFTDLSGTGNFSLNSFTFTDVNLDAARSTNDAGTFTANGIDGNWVDTNGTVAGENFQGEPLSLIGPQNSDPANGDLNPFDGSDVTTFAHERTGDGDYRFEEVGFKVTIDNAAVPEPSSLTLLAMFSLLAAGRRRRK